MSLKTWFHFIPVIGLFTLLPVIVIMLPTVELHGNYWGGGPIRQYLVNTAIVVLKPAYSSALVNTFMQGSSAKEVLITLPIALNISWAMLLVIYAAGSIYIELNNIVSRGIYSSQRQKAKGASK